MSQVTSSGFDPLAGGTGAPVSAQVSRIKPINPIRILRQYFWLLVGTGVVGIVLGVGVFFGINFLNYRSWVSQIGLLVTPPPRDMRSAAVDSSGDMVSEARNMLSFLNTQVSIIYSEVVLERALKDPEVQNTRWYSAYRDNPLQAKLALEGILAASPRRNTSLLDLSVHTRVDREAPIILNSVVQSYIAFIDRENRRSNEDLLSLLRGESETARTELEAVITKINAFRQASGVSDLESTFNDTETGYRLLLDQRAKTAVDLDRSRAFYESARSQASGGITGNTLQEIMGHPAVLNLDAQVRDLRQRLDMALVRYGPQHRQSIDFQKMIESAEIERDRKIEELARERNDAMIAAAAMAVENLEQSLAENDAKLPAMERRRQEITNLREEYRRLQIEEEQARAKVLAAEAPIKDLQLFTRRPDFTRVRQLGSASEPELVFPKAPMVVFVSAFLLLLLVSSIIILRELLDQRIRGSEDVKSLPGGDLVGVVPDAEQVTNHKQKSRFELCSLDQPTGIIAESFRQIRSSLNRRIDQRGYRSLMVVSAQPEGGTTSVIVNLAASWAAQGRRVLVIDGNVRKPELDRCFKKNAERGLLDILRGKMTFDEAVIKLDPINFDLLPAGHWRDVPAEFFERPEFQKLLADLEPRYDLILIDVAPGLITSDASLMARSVDAAILVARAARDERGAFSRLIRIMQDQRCDIAGIILNGARYATGGYFRENFNRFTQYQAEAEKRFKSAAAVSAAVAKA